MSVFQLTNPLVDVHGKALPDAMQALDKMDGTASVDTYAVLGTHRRTLGTIGDNGAPEESPVLVRYGVRLEYAFPYRHRCELVGRYRAAVLEPGTPAKSGNLPPWERYLVHSQTEKLSGKTPTAEGPGLFKVNAVRASFVWGGTCEAPPAVNAKGEPGSIGERLSRRVAREVLSIAQRYFRMTDEVEGIEARIAARVLHAHTLRFPEGEETTNADLEGLLGGEE